MAIAPIYSWVTWPIKDPKEVMTKSKIRGKSCNVFDGPFVDNDQVLCFLSTLLFKNHCKWSHPVLNHQNCASSTCCLSYSVVEISLQSTIHWLQTHCLRSAHAFVSLDSEIGVSEAWRVKGIWGDFHWHSWFCPSWPETQPVLCSSFSSYLYWAPRSLCSIVKSSPNYLADFCWQTQKN